MVVIEAGHWRPLGYIDNGGGDAQENGSRTIVSKGLNALPHELLI